MRLLMVIIAMVLFSAMMAHRSKGGLIEWIFLLIGLGCGASLVWEAFT